MIAADRAGDGLQAVKETYSDEIANGRLTIVDFDIAESFPFEADSLDSVTCQNVIECLSDRDSVLAEIHRVLKPGGSALVGHNDFDGVLLASDDRDMTRRMVHGYADYTQKWQDVSEGQMGRLLPGLFANSPFKDTDTETALFVDLALTNESYARDYLEGVVALSQEFGVLVENAQKWIRSLEARSEVGKFYYAIPWTYVLAVKS